MRKLNIGWVFGLAMGLAIPSFSAAYAAGKTVKSEEASTAGMSKDEAERVKEHNKLRAEIKKVKYPAAKGDDRVEGEGRQGRTTRSGSRDTLPDKTYASADDVYQRLGWEDHAGCAGRASKRWRVGRWPADSAGRALRVSTLAAGDRHALPAAWAAAHLATSRERRRLSPASSAGGSSSARPTLWSRPTGGTTRAIRRWWSCPAIAGCRWPHCRPTLSGWPT